MCERLDGEGRGGSSALRAANGSQMLAECARSACQTQPGRSEQVRALQAEHHHAVQQAPGPLQSCRLGARARRRASCQASLHLVTQGAGAYTLAACRGMQQAR